MTLDDYLGQHYRAAVVAHEPIEPVIASLRKAMADDPALATEAHARLAALADIDEQRCFISKQHRACLSAALSAR